MVLVTMVLLLYSWCRSNSVKDFTFLLHDAFAEDCFIFKYHINIDFGLTLFPVCFLALRLHPLFSSVNPKKVMNAGAQ